MSQLINFLENSIVFNLNDGFFLQTPNQDEMLLTKEDYKKLKYFIVKQLKGNWNRSKKGFDFPFDPSVLIDRIIRGETIDLRKHQLFETDPNFAGAIWHLLELIGVHWWNFTNGKVLEPSCGTGNLVCRLHQNGFRNIDYCEKVEAFESIAIERFKKSNIVANKVGTDFLKLDRQDYYDFVFFNPPFRHDLKHFRKVTEVLKPNGFMLGIFPISRFTDEKIESFLNKEYSVWEMQLYEDSNKKQKADWIFSNTHCGCVVIAGRKKLKGFQTKLF